MDDDSDDVIILEDANADECTNDLPSENSLAITSKAKLTTKALWDRATTTKPATDSGSSCVPKSVIGESMESKPDFTTLSISVPNELLTENGSSNNPKREPSEACNNEVASNLFDILTRSLPQFPTTGDIGTSLNNGSTFNGEESRRRRRKDDEDEEEVRFVDSKEPIGIQKNEAAASNVGSVATLERFRKKINRYAMAKSNASCDCAKRRRELVNVTTRWQTKMMTMWRAHKKLEREFVALKAKHDSRTAPVSRRTVSVQTDLPQSGTVPQAVAPPANSTGISGPKMISGISPVPDLFRYPPPVLPPPTVASSSSQQSAQLRSSFARGNAVIRRPNVVVTKAPRQLDSMNRVRTYLSSSSSSPVLPAKPLNTSTLMSALFPAVQNQNGALQPPRQHVPAAVPTVTPLPTQTKPNFASATPPKQLNGVNLPSPVRNSVGRAMQNFSAPTLNRALPPRLTRAPSDVSSIRASSTATKVYSAAAIRLRGGSTSTVGGLAPPRFNCSTSSSQYPQAAVSSSSSSVEVSNDYPPLPSLKTCVAATSLLAASAVFCPNPPRPQLSVSKGEDGHVVLCWDVPNMPHHVVIKSYRLYSYEKGSCEGWTIVSDIDALQLPMACTLGSLGRGKKYYFVAAAEDKFGRFGPFSEVCSHCV